MANSFRYHYSSQKISTVSRAIMVLGFEKVRSLTISLVLVDSLQAGQQVIILEEALNEAEEAYSTYPDPDPQLQLTIQQDMTAAFEEKPNINIILEMVLEGLHRGMAWIGPYLLFCRKIENSLYVNMRLVKAMRSYSNNSK